MVFKIKDIFGILFPLFFFTFLLFLPAKDSFAQVTSCTGQNLGTSCFVNGISGENGSCYDGKCLAGKGNLGEVCGDTAGSACVESGKCNGLSNWDLNGRDCSSNLTCCKNSLVKVTDCTGQKLGTACSVNNKVGYCYNEKCETEIGEINQICGAKEGSICVQTVTTLCTSKDSTGGRDCSSGLTCCEKSGIVSGSCAEAGGKCLTSPDNTFAVKSSSESSNKSCSEAYGSTFNCYLSSSSNACTSAGGKCFSGQCSTDYPTSSSDSAHQSACQATGFDTCCLPSECAKKEGECKDSCTGNYEILNDDAAETSCGSNKLCCVLSACAKNNGQCVSEDTTCDNPLTQYDNSCDGPAKCCGAISQKCPEREEGLEGGFLFFKGSLVPCGRHCDDSGTTDIDETKTCTLCHFLILFKRLYDLLLSLLIIVSLVMITAGGVLYIVSTGNPRMIGIAKGLIVKTLVGFGLFLLSWLIVFTILKFISAKTSLLGTGSSWFQFTCDIESAFEGKAATPAATPSENATVNGYVYNTADIKNVDEQKNDASSNLNTLLSCMQSKLSDEAKEISSVSDSAGIENCVTNTWTDAACAHSKNSCHYGGTNCPGKSYAVDFKNESKESELRSAARECNTTGTVKFLKESNHIHISVNGATCGCDGGLSAP